MGYLSDRPARRRLTLRPYFCGERLLLGTNAYGEMGITPAGLSTRYETPQQMSGEPRWTTIAGSWATFCGLDSAGDTWCWGHGADGELGDSQNYSTVPLRIGGL